MDRKLRNIVAINIAIVAVCLFVSLFFGTGIESNETAGRALIDTTYGYSVMTISVAIITFFGILDLPGGREADGSFTSGRIRFCITATLLMTFIIYLGTTGYWDDQEKVTEFQKLMIPDLFALLMIVIPFYFAATAAVEILKGRNATPSDTTPKSLKQDDRG